MEKINQIILSAIQKKIQKIDELEDLKRTFAKKNKTSFPRHEEVRLAYQKMLKKGIIKKNLNLEQLLVSKKTRTLSGVSIVAVLTKPYPCKNHCLYCPKEKAMPKSYLSNEPAVMRAIRLNFNPYLQVSKRLKVLHYNGHDTSKVELIVMGGTFSHLSTKYQFWFVANCFKAVNDFYQHKNKISLESKFNLKEIKLKKDSCLKLQIKEKTSLVKLKQCLEKEKHKNIFAKNRIVGLTLETRPDSITQEELKKFRILGSTRVEIGVQSIYDDVLKKNDRGHKVRAIIKATRLLKDFGFKINYHMMPGLLGSNLKKDYLMFKKIFNKEDFQPDMVKIYPCVVVKNAPLYKLWKAKKYFPLKSKDLKDLIIKIKALVPEYVRITRLIRDIPSSSIEAGPDIPNLREILQGKKIRCLCIRCREVGRIDNLASDCFVKKAVKMQTEKGLLKINRIDYLASQGNEVFLQIISGREKKLHAFLRLRKLKNYLIKELEQSAIIREVHSYGKVVPIGQVNFLSSQHCGFGKILIKEAENITRKEFQLPYLTVIASEGVKEYYYKLGFQECGLYLRKKL